MDLSFPKELKIQFADGVIQEFSPEDVRLIIDKFETIRNYVDDFPNQIVLLDNKEFPITSRQFYRILQKYQNEFDNSDFMIEKYLGGPSYAMQMLPYMKSEKTSIFVKLLKHQIKNGIKIKVYDQSMIVMIELDGLQYIDHSSKYELTDETRTQLKEQLYLLSYHEDLYECYQPTFFSSVKKLLEPLGFELIKIIFRYGMSSNCTYVFLKIM